MWLLCTQSLRRLGFLKPHFAETYSILPLMNTLEIFSKPEICKDSEGLWFYSNGLEATAESFSSSFSFSIPKNTQVCLVDFTPFGEAEYIIGTRTLAIAKSLRGLHDFFQYLDDPNTNEDLKMPYPEYLYSIANLRMARFAKILGFEISNIDDFPEFNEIEELPLDKKVVFIAGRTEVIKDRLLELKRRYPENSKFFRRASVEYANFQRLQSGLN